MNRRKGFARNFIPFILLPFFLILGKIEIAAKVIGIEIEHRDTILEGKLWGDVGAYELWKGKIFFGTNPDIDVNQKIVDIHLAPVNGDGLVESMADFVVLKPLDQSRSKIGLVEVSNRGGKFTPSYFLGGSGRLENPEVAMAYGDGLLLEHGITIIWIGWQFDIPEGPHNLNFKTPVAKYPEGTPIIGLARSDWTVDEMTHQLKLGHRDQKGYPAYDPSSQIHQLTKRAGRDSTRILIDRNAWDFGKWEAGEAMENRHWISSPEGFEAGMIYELVYYTSDPPLVGLGLSAIRDVIAFAKYDTTCLFKVEKGIAVGVSQTGRFLRHFLYQGFNETENGQIAYDGMMVMTAGAGRGSFNHRFAQPSRDAHRYSAFFYPTDLFPFTGKTQMDEESHQTDGLLLKIPTSLQPKIIYINTGYEYYGRAAALIHTSLDGKSDVLPMENERIYHIAGGQHFVDQFPPKDTGTNKSIYIGNPLQFKPNYRALLMALREWVLDIRLPPPSTFPLIRNKELISVQELEYPNIPSFEAAKSVHEAYRVDYGPNWSRGLITLQPPKINKSFPSLVPQINNYGNEISGIQNFELAVPLATYIPYSLRKNVAGGVGELADFRGTYIPLSIYENPIDARPAITELYASKNQYLSLARKHLDGLASKRFILLRDIHVLMDRANAYWNWIHRFEKKMLPNETAVMTFNIRYDNPQDGISSWDFRKDQVKQVIDSFGPDFLGLQEALEHQCKDVDRGLKGYKWIGVGREDGKKKGEFAPIFYQSKKWKIINWNYFWLSETPDQPSKGWDAAHERIVTWGEFKSRKNSETLYVFNTHFDHRGNIARLRSAELVKTKIKDIAGDHPFILMGDFNFGAESEPYLQLTAVDDQSIADTKHISFSQPLGPAGTFSGFTVQKNQPQKRIDHLFIGRHMLANQFEVINKSTGGFYASDHFAVYSKIGWQ